MTKEATTAMRSMLSKRGLLFVLGGGIAGWAVAYLYGALGST